MTRSTKLMKDRREESKKELLQYRLFENDSDNEVIEGLGNTTLAAGLSSNEDSIGSGGAKAGKPDDKEDGKIKKEKSGQESKDNKNIIEIAI